MGSALKNEGSGKDTLHDQLEDIVFSMMSHISEMESLITLARESHFLVSYNFAEYFDPFSFFSVFGHIISLIKDDVCKVEDVSHAHQERMERKERMEATMEAFADELTKDGPAVKKKHDTDDLRALVKDVVQEVYRERLTGGFADGDIQT
jgi:hypothetical protein